MTEQGETAAAETGNDGVVVAVSGRATIQVVSELKGRLMLAIGSAHRVTVDVSGVTGADSSFFQLLCSAHRTSVASGGRLELGAAPSEEFLGAALATGFDQAGRHCNLDNCIW